MSREEGDEPLVGKPNLQGVENTGAIPRTYHRSRLQPGSTLFTLRPFFPPFPKRKEAEKRTVRPFPPDLGIFSSFFALSLSLSLRPLPRYRVPDKKMAGRLESSFLKNARTCLRAHRTYTSTITHPHEPSFHSWLGKVFQKTLKMHDIRLVRKRGSTRIDNRVHNGQTLGYRWLGYTCITRERWEFLGGGGGCTDVSRWIGIRNRRIFCFPFPR